MIYNIHYLVIKHGIRKMMAMEMQINRQKKLQ